MKSTIHVSGMSCEHCVKAVKDAVDPLPGVENVSVDLGKGEVTIEYDSAAIPLEKIEEAIEDQGYDIEK